MQLSAQPREIWDLTRIAYSCLAAQCMPVTTAELQNDKSSSDSDSETNSSDDDAKFGMAATLQPLLDAVEYAESRIASIRDELRRLPRYSIDNFAHDVHQERFFRAEEKQYADNTAYLKRCKKELNKRISKANKRKKDRARKTPEKGVALKLS